MSAPWELPVAPSPVIIQLDRIHVIVVVVIALMEMDSPVMVNL